MNREDFNERQIIEMVLSGQKDQYRHLVRANQDKIYSLIMRQIGDEQTSADLTQEVMLKGYLNLKKFRFESSFSTWLTRIALNTSN